ncbi:MAG: class I SAM-dependent methyltransferase, partial [Prosthecochloris sp.]
MNGSIYETKLRELLESAGIIVNGTNPWDIRVLDRRFYKRVITESHLGIGESYMDGWWECDALDEFFYRILRARLDHKVSQTTRILSNLAGLIVNLQRPSRAFQVGETHYNVGNELYEAMLDRHMLYSCAYWKDAQDLDTA